MRRNRRRRKDRDAQGSGVIDLTRAEAPQRPVARGPASFVADQVHDRRRDAQRRASVERMLASLDDPDEREAYLRSIRGQARGAEVR